MDRDARLREIAATFNAARPRGIKVQDTSNEPETVTLGTKFVRNGLKPMLLKVYLVLKTYRDNKTGYPTQQELADAAGVTRPTFHAAVKALEELGYVKTWRGGIGEKGKGQLVYELKKALF